MLDSTPEIADEKPTAGVSLNQVHGPMHVEKARRLVRSEIRSFFRKHAALLDDALDDESSSARMLAWALRITTGVGKSTMCAEEAAAAWRELGVPIVILTPTRELAARYVAQLRDAGCSDVQLYTSRQSPDAVERDPSLQPWRCWKVDAVRAAGEQNHMPAQSLCRECPHGRVSEFRCGFQERETRARAWLKSHSVDIDETAGCNFLYDGLPRVKAAGIIVAPAAAFSEALAYYYPPRAPGEKPRKLRRAVVVDEAIGLGKLVRVGLGDLETWIKRVDALRAYALKQSGFARSGDDDDDRDWRAIGVLCESADAIYRGMAAALVLRQAPSTDLLVALFDDAKRAGLVGAGIVAWERIAFTDEKHFSVPLRALKSLVQSARSGTLRTLSTGLEFYEPAPILDWAKSHGSTLFMDATLPLPIRKIIAGWGGRMVNAVARQNLLLTRIIGQRYARGEPSKSGFRDTSSAFVRDYQIIAMERARGGGCWALLCHMAHILYGGEAGFDPKSLLEKSEAAARNAAEFHRLTAVPLGWWGRHHKGHDSWKHRHMLIFGQPILGYTLIENCVESGSMVDAWRLARAAALTAGCSAGCWPADIGEMDAGELSGGLPLPLDPRVRAWLVDLYAGDLVQAVGRARATDCPYMIRVELWGGVDAPEIDAALLVHGLEVEERWPNEVHHTRRGQQPGMAGDALARAVSSIRDDLTVEGRRANVRSVAARLRAQGHRARQSAIAQALKLA